MEFGLAVFVGEDTHSPVEFGRMAEERGFESLFFPEHTHIPTSRETPYPAGGELPPEYSRTLDPFVALSAAATATEQLKIGTGICLVVQRDPIGTANAVASLDVVSGGRFLFGVGAGWNLEEMRNHGTDPSRRFSIMRERIEAMKEIWTKEEAEYHGRFVDFDPIWSWPKPVHKPHPPILVGGHGEKVLDRVIAYGDEWFPNRIGGDDLLIARIEELFREARDTGREVGVTVAGASRKPEVLERYAKAGVHRSVYWLPNDDRATVEASIDECAAAAEAYNRAGG